MLFYKGEPPNVQLFRLADCEIAVLCIVCCNALLTFLLTYMIIPLKVQMILTALFFAPLIIFYFLTQTEKEHSSSSEMQRKKDALFAEKYGLTAREAQVLDCLCKLESFRTPLPGLRSNFRTIDTFLPPDRLRPLHKPWAYRNNTPAVFHSLHHGENPRPPWSQPPPSRSSY